MLSEPIGTRRFLHSTLYDACKARLVKVAQILGELRFSGAERMFACSYSQWLEAGVEPVIFGMADGPHPFAASLMDAGYEVHTLPNIRSVHGQAALWRALRGVKPQIIHTHAESCFDVVALQGAAAPAVGGIVRTVHNNFRYSGALRARRTVRRALAGRVGTIWVACSEDVASTERSYTRGAVRVIENWADGEGIMREATRPAALSVRQELRIPREAPVLAVIGNCNEAKNHELVPRALEHVSKPVHILHAGSSGDQPESETRAWRDLPRRHTVHHLSQRRDVPALLAASRLLLVPSLWEGLPIIAIEALFARVPLITTDALGLRWLGTVPSATQLTPQPSVWAAAISDAVSTGVARATVEESFVLARTRFSPERGVAEYAKAYATARRNRVGLNQRHNGAPED